METLKEDFIFEEKGENQIDEKQMARLSNMGKKKKLKSIKNIKTNENM